MESIEYYEKCFDEPTPTIKSISNDNQISVSDLIRYLSDMPLDALVAVEGCDCIGEANGIRVMSDGDILITRLP